MDLLRHCMFRPPQPQVRNHATPSTPPSIYVSSLRVHISHNLYSDTWCTNSYTDHIEKSLVGEIRSSIDFNVAGQPQPQALLQHFSHSHPLILSNLHHPQPQQKI
ncbi:unnamed protein product [Malus baccata var. baccata]